MPRGYPKSRPGPWQFTHSLQAGARTADTVIGSVAAQLKARLAIIDDEATHIRRALAGLGVRVNGTRTAVPMESEGAPPARPAKKKKRTVSPAALAAMRANAEKARLAKQGDSTTKGRKLHENAVPLSKLVIEILSAGAPLTTAEIADQALARGYNTTSPNFKTVVQAGMKNLPVKKVRDGKWSLNESRSVQRRKAVQQGKPMPLFGGKAKGNGKAATEPPPAEAP
jgi:hypothetical protein